MPGCKDGAHSGFAAFAIVRKRNANVIFIKQQICANVVKCHVSYIFASPLLYAEMHYFMNRGGSRKIIRGVPQLCVWWPYPLYQHCPIKRYGLAPLINWENTHAQRDTEGCVKLWNTVSCVWGLVAALLEPCCSIVEALHREVSCQKGGFGRTY